MARQLIKPIIAGILAGAALFVMPFFFVRILLFILIIGGLFRLFRGRGFRGWGYGFHPAFADTIRHMSEEEYQAFRQKFESHHHHPYHRRREETNTDNKS